MLTGWWLRTEDEYFDCLNNTPQGNLFPLLHGFCPVFASALHDRYGYHIYGAFIYDEEIEENGLVHAFCETPEGHLVDVRGITDDWDAFMAAFEDEFPDIDDLDVQSFDTAGFEDEDMYAFALSVIDMNADYYCPSRF